MTLTTEEAARILGIDPSTLRHWVLEGRITPVLPRSKPMRFRELDVEVLLADKMPSDRHARLDTLRDEWLAS